jgi:hypothetical protein
VTKLLLTIHVLAAIVAIGPVTVAASMFPAAVRRGDAPTLRTLNRICRVYAALGVVLPVFGLATATSLGVLGDAWLITSIALTVVAAVVLGLVILPAQAAALPGENRPAPTATDPGGVSSAETGAAAAPQDDNVSPERSSVLVVDERARNAAAARRLGMVTGVFNLLWVTVVVLMIVRPGSTTGA